MRDYVSVDEEAALQTTATASEIEDNLWGSRWWAL
jgi:hypothetical protein